MKVVIALGGNAINKPDQEGSYNDEILNVRAACEGIVKIIKAGHDVILTHGNGPQVGNLSLLEQSTSANLPLHPLHSLGAMTQGEIGYMIQQELGNLLRSQGIERPVATILTQTLVSASDRAFQNPSKPVGLFCSEEVANKLSSEKGYVMKKLKNNGPAPFRRVVPSPDPIKIVEDEIITRLVETGVIVICSGGGGIPVISSKGEYKGVDAVIDKDLAGGILAESVRAEMLLILTNVEKIVLDYGKPNEIALDRMTTTEARRYLDAGHFAPGSMGPKVLACVRFVEWGGKMGIVAPLEKALEALDGLAGTQIVKY